tara:strand:+ start:395 stop:640 length:246 start_codon:yes stop_codon:yes gene_type:complete
MVLYGWWYLIGIAIVVVVYLGYIAPSENRHWKRRLKLYEDRIRKKEEKEIEKQEISDRLEQQRRVYRTHGRARRRFIRKPK